MGVLAGMEVRAFLVVLRAMVEWAVSPHTYGYAPMSDLRLRVVVVVVVVVVAVVEKQVGMCSKN
jgi:hypothetical protein